MQSAMNYEEVLKTLKLLRKDNQLFEIRILNGKWTASGYFTSPEVAIEELKNDMRDYNDELVYDIDSQRTEDGKYLITSFKIIDEKTKNGEFERIFKKKC